MGKIHSVLGSQYSNFLQDNMQVKAMFETAHCDKDPKTYLNIIYNLWCNSKRFGVDTAPSRQGLAGSIPEHSEGKTSLGAVREFDKTVGSRPNHLGKVLPRSGSGGATLWVWNLGADGSNDAKDQGRTLGIPAAGSGEEGVKARGRDLEEGGGGQCASGGGNKTS